MILFLIIIGGIFGCVGVFLINEDLEIKSKFYIPGTSKLENIRNLDLIGSSISMIGVLAFFIIMFLGE